LTLGFAQRPITPLSPLPLAGIGSRSGLPTTLDELMVRAVWFGGAQSAVLIVSLDLLWVSRSLADTLRACIGATHGLAPECILICATHTHGGPQTREQTHDGLVVDPDYRRYLIAQVEAAAAAAVAAIGPSRFSIGSATTRIGINRRRAILDIQALRRFRLRRTMANRPNPAGPVDDQVDLLWATPAEGDELVLVTAACHPTVMRGNQVTADFPGRLSAALSSRVRRPVNVVFLQGFSGDIRPRLIQTLPRRGWPPLRALQSWVDRDQFRTDGSVEDMQAIAAELAAAIHQSQLRPLDRLAPSGHELEIELPLEQQHPPVSFRLQLLRLSDQAALVGCEGEMFSDYAVWLRTLCAPGQLLFPVGCAGGMVGYLPDAASLAQGGYEVDRSRPIFGLPARFERKIDGLIRGAIETLVNGRAE